MRRRGKGKEKVREGKEQGKEKKRRGKISP